MKKRQIRPWFVAAPGSFKAPPLTLSDDGSVERIHLRLCKRAIESRSYIVALEEAAEEIADLQRRLRESGKQ